MTIREYTNRLTANLEPLYGVSEARAITLLVVESLCGVTKVELALEPWRELVPNARLQQVEAKLVEGQPVQYALGWAEFCGLEFFVDENVLIPRGETEELVGWIVSNWGGVDRVRILDIGSGSGSISVALAKKLPQPHISSIDVSTGALVVARQNADAHNVDVEFLLQDALENISTWHDSLKVEQYDVVVSNPPYIPHSDKPSIGKHVTDYEPHVALFPNGDDPLIFYRAICHNALELLRSGGMLYFEIYSDFGAEIYKLLEEVGYKDIALREDINSKPRMVRCTRR